MAKARDQGFISFKAKLETTQAPYDPFAGVGDPDDTARYTQQPGIDFLRPWLAIQNGAAFQWPLGLEGYNLTVDPTLGIHKFIGDNAVSIDVLHAGEEHFTMSGSFPGHSAPALIQALRDVVYKSAPDEVGKILYIPSIFTYAQRVHVNHFEADRDGSGFGNDATYSIEFIRIGTTSTKTSTVVPSSSGASPKGKSSKSMKTTATYRTLRTIAKLKLGSLDDWRKIYNLNTSYFTKHGIPLAKAPTYKLPIGTTIYF